MNTTQEPRIEKDLYRLFLEQHYQYNQNAMKCQPSEKFKQLLENPALWIEEDFAEVEEEPDSEAEEEPDAEVELSMEALRVTEEDDESDELDEEQYRLDSLNKNNDLKRARTETEKILIEYTYSVSHQDILFAVKKEMKFAGWDFLHDISLRYNLFYTRCEQYL